MDVPMPLADALALALTDPAIARLAKRLPHRFLLRADGTTLSVVESEAACEVSASAPLAVWQDMLQRLPVPGRQSAGAALRSDCGFALEGERIAAAQTLPLLEALIDAMRHAANPTPQAQAPVSASPSLDRLRSRYLRVTDPNGPQGCLFEESAGDPDQPVLLLLHTAGADARQWHALMTNEALGRDWQMVAFDMPCHGRSPPPDGWRGEPWTLDTDRYLAWIVAWMQARGVRRIAIAGCSMGAAIGLAFLARHSDLALGAILLEAPWRSPGRRTELLDHPAVHGGRFGAAWVQALLSPHSPEQHRRTATWIYSQAAPGVYEGDLGFYSDEFDAAVHAPQIDTAQTPLWLMTGDYDYSASPAESKRIADAIPGAHFVLMQGLGHFPMTENPERLLTHFAPAAAALRAHTNVRETL